MHLFNQNKTKLNIEIISPGSLSGWVFHEKFQFIKIFLEVNKKVLAESEINIPRKDVNQNFNLKEKQVVGFILNLPLELDYEAEEISIFAKTELRTKRYYFLEKKNIKDYSFLKKILNSNYLGRKGNIDGFQNDGQITGWVYHEKKRRFI